MTGLTHKEHFKKIEKSPGVYILIDGDGLKKINDVHGHNAGHAAILAISDGIKAALRQKDNVTVTRSGGDEFIVHIEGVSIPTGVAIGNRILEKIHQQKISDHYTGDPETKKKLEGIELKASLGVGYTEEEADKALYQAKNKGRDRVEFFKAKEVARLL
jgi:diguanylate cyclase (GGDEF)-like protein